VASPLRAIRGSAESSTVTLGMALSALRFWEGVFEKAAGDLAVASDTPERIEARRRFDAANVRLEQVLNRRDRLVCETQGLRWLWVAGSNADG
jgi:hypothetical protein